MDFQMRGYQNRINLKYGEPLCGCDAYFSHFNAHCSTHKMICMYFYFWKPFHFYAILHVCIFGIGWTRVFFGANSYRFAQFYLHLCVVFFSLAYSKVIIIQHSIAYYICLHKIKQISFRGDNFFLRKVFLESQKKM